MVDSNKYIKEQFSQVNSDNVISLIKRQNNPPILSQLIEKLDIEINNWKTQTDEYYTRNVNKIKSIKKFNQIIRLIKTNTDIIFRKADKGKRLVILYKDMYILEAMKQLSDNEYYQTITENRLNSYKDRLIQIIDILINDGYIEHSMGKKLFNTDYAYSDRYFYLLPKIHKVQEKWTIPGILPKGRPVVSFTNSNLQFVSQYIDFFLQKIAIQTDSYLRNSIHLISLINNLGITNWSNVGIWTADVVSLYPNIDIDYGLDNIRETFLLFPDRKRPNEYIIELLELVLRNNDFIFLNQRYLQIKGTAMGAPFSPSYANSVLHVWEKDIIHKYRDNIILYKRYIDDLIIITRTDVIPNGMDILIELNCKNPSLKLEIEDTPKEQVFLDIHFHINNDTMTYKTNFKQTDTRRILPVNSQHPKHIFSGILKSQICRYIRNTNDRKIAYKQMKNLIKINKDNGYTLLMGKKIWKDVIQQINFINNYKTFHYILCTSSRCLTCPIFDTESQYVSAKFGGNQIRLYGQFTCSDTYIIYCLTCKHCAKQYVGLSTNQLRDRMTNHRSCMKNRRETKILYKHCYRFHLQLSDFKLQILYKINKKRLANMIDRWKINLLQHYENYYIRKLNTLIPMGFNEKLGKKLRTNIPVVLKWTWRNSKIINICKKLIRNYIKDNNIQHLPIRFIPAFYVNRKLGSYISKNKM